MGINGSHPESHSHSGRSIRALCQLCGRYYYGISSHVRKIHHANITDLEAEGKWVNERFPEQ
ncbi:MAG TPA: hypothetical protein VEP90_18405 [Methylomirabilota bacterium]|nr:hypothetical protein [Methylomirabilota bacterium]